MRKRKLKIRGSGSSILGVAGAVLILSTLPVGCGHEKGQKAELIPLEIEASVEELGERVKSAVSGTSFADSNTINVFVKGASYDSLVTRYTKMSGGWTVTSEGSITLSENAAEVYASYPVEEEKDSVGMTKSVTPSVGSLSIPVTIRNPQRFDGAEQSDYMYALSSERNRMPYRSAEVNRESNTATLVFMHGLSELTFNLKATGYEGKEVYVTEIRLEKSGEGFEWGEGRMSLEASPESRFELLKSGRELYFNGIRKLGSESESISGLVVPTGAEGIGVELHLVIDGEPKIVYGRLPVGSGSVTIGEWESGTDYEYGIELKSGALSFDSVSINAWRRVDVGEITVE
ncbi:MAG: fimbrillin family protein [Bacteroidales bacterium]|jgi:hypothetical protein|nr:fimbrillin family protein [Bacteroidales bacterium]